MQTKIKKFLHIFIAELEELKDDLIFFEKLHKEREEKGEITNYVYLENKGLIQDEISGIQNIAEAAHKMLKPDYGSLDEMIEDLSSKIKARIKESGHSDAAYFIVERKIQKVKKYLLDELDLLESLE